MEFEKQSEIMDMKEEMMEDAIDDAMGDEEDEEEGDKIVQQVLDELGLDLGDKLNGRSERVQGWKLELLVGILQYLILYHFLCADLPMAKDSMATPAAATAGKSPVAEGAGVGDLDADLQSRLDNLRRE